MKKRPTGFLCSAALAAVGTTVSMTSSPDELVDQDALAADSVAHTDTLPEVPPSAGVVEKIEQPSASDILSEADIIKFAEEKGLEVAAVKAVIDIETGKTHKAFWANGKPLINFDRFVFAKMAKKNKLNLEPYKESHSLVFNPAVFSNYGEQQAAEQARLDCAMTIDPTTAIEGTFWGMFQIGGFNWKLCKTSNPQEFVDIMSRSALDQLELFGSFLESAKLMRHLKDKNWTAFARGYNGPGYAKHNYHIRLANAYSRHKAEEAEK